MTETNDFDHLLEFLPQKPPSRYVDHVLEVEFQKRVGGTVCFAAGHRVFDGHLPGEPLVPGVVIVEALAQLAGIALMGEEGTPIHGYLAEAGPVRFLRTVSPDETIRLEAEIEQAFGAFVRFAVGASVGDEPVAKGRITVARRDGSVGSSSMPSSN